MFKKFILTSFLLFSSLITIYPSKKENTNFFDYWYSLEKIIYSNSLLNKKFLLFKKFTKKKFKFSIKKEIIYSLSIFGFVIILGLLLFFISQFKKNESKITNKSILLEQRF